MNYRHVYHAGNFADVLKHAILAAIVTYLQRKDAAFRVIDTHAGPGRYELASEQAQKTGEWRSGIGRLTGGNISPALAAFLAPYLSAVAAANGGLSAVAAANGSDAIEQTIGVYPGSPMIVRHLLRKQDRLSAIELHPEDVRALGHLFEGDHQVRVTELDGWLALGAHLPPKEKRGLVLIDPPFEKEGEFARMVEGLDKATRRFAGGTYCLWYPLKAGSGVESFHRALQELARPRTLIAELWVRDPATEKGLNGSGLAIVNPPFTLEAELNAVLPELTRLLAQDGNAGFRLEILVGE